MRTVRRVLAGVALGALAGWSSAGEVPLEGLSETSARIQRQNQALADELASAYRTSGQLQGYFIDIEADGGVVTLSGAVANGGQKETLLTMTRRHPGVVAVLDRTEVESKTPTLFVANYQPATAAPAPARLPAQQPPATTPHTEPTPTHGRVTPPAPIHEFPGGVAPFSDEPILPPYSWPAYTPYNNFASVAYQTQYPSGAWPFIGPPYPYPMIPSGWRSVTLRWSRGYWWLKFHSH